MNDMPTQFNTASGFTAAFVTTDDRYWAIGGDVANVYQSKTNTVVPVSNADFITWQEGFGAPTPIGSEAELASVLKNTPLLPEWMFNAPTFIQPSPGAYTKEQLAAYNADARWRKEQGGITTTAGFPLRTDDRAQAKITGTYTAKNEVPSVTTPWHDADGAVHILDAGGLHQLHVDLLTHINNCFSISADVIAAINAGSVTTLAAIDAAYAAPITAARKNWLRPPAAKKEK